MDWRTFATRMLPHLILSLLLCLFLLQACGSRPQFEPPPPEVIVTKVVARDVPVVSEWLGTTEGFVDATVRAQVTGYLISRDYREGRYVKTGDVLFRINPNPFQAALEQAQGEYAQAAANLQREKLDVKRYKPLLGTGAVSQREYDNSVQLLQAAEGALRTAKAVVDKARIDLGFTEIRSPVNGIAGVARAQVGDLVGPGDAQPLTTVSQLDPMKVAFPLSEQDYLRYAPRIQLAVEQGQFPKDMLQLILANGETYPYRGTAYPAGLNVDPRTGTIVMKGEIPNPKGLLRPGQFVRVRVEMDYLVGALVVPQRALMDLQGRKQLAIVSADGTVEIRSVEAGPTWEGLVVIGKGVTAGEQVIVEGGQKVRPGMRVAIKPVEGAPSQAGD